MTLLLKITAAVHSRHAWQWQLPPTDSPTACPSTHSCSHGRAAPHVAVRLQARKHFLIAARCM